MKNKFSLLIIIAIILTGLKVYSQTADEIFNKSIKALGGEELLSSIKSTKIILKMSTSGMDIPMTISKKGESFRVEQEIMGQKMTMGYDGQNGWMIMPGSEQAQPVSSEQLDMIKNYSDFGDSPMLGIKKKNVKMELAGKEKVEGVTAYKIKLIEENKPDKYIYISTENFFPIKIYGSEEQMGQKTEYEMLMKDYKNVKGVNVCHQMDITTGNTNISITFVSYEMNSITDDSIFKMPK